MTTLLEMMFFALQAFAGSSQDSRMSAGEEPVIIIVD
jgi:hypothetical protein